VSLEIIVQSTVEWGRDKIVGEIYNIHNWPTNNAFALSTLVYHFRPIGFAEAIIVASKHLPTCVK
jgi:hypothetical protein